MSTINYTKIKQSTINLIVCQDYKFKFFVTAIVSQNYSEYNCIIKLNISFLKARALDNLVVHHNRVC